MTEQGSDLEYDSGQDNLNSKHFWLADCYSEQVGTTVC